MSALTKFKRRQMVYDRWWPHKVGIVTSCSPSGVWVRWTGGELWKYDRKHLQFLVPVKR